MVIILLFRKSTLRLFCNKVEVIFKRSIVLVNYKVLVQMINCRNDTETDSIRALE